MFRQVVVGIDEDAGSRDALALARALLDKDGRLTLAHVHRGDARMRTVSPELAGAERTRARRLLETVRAEAGGDARLVWTGASSVGRGLHEIAEHDDADLLVVGSSEHSLFGHTTLSAHTRDALNGAPCAVALAPAGYRERAVVVREIGVGYDGSPESEHAVVVARQLADELGAKVSAFEAIALPIDLVEGPGVGDEKIDRSLAQARERVALLGVEPHAAYGHPAEELQSTARRLTCWFSDRAATGRLAGCSTAAPPSAWLRGLAARCLCSRAPTSMARLRLKPSPPSIERCCRPRSLTPGDLEQQ